MLEKRIDVNNKKFEVNTLGLQSQRTQCVKEGSTYRRRLVKTLNAKRNLTDILKESHAKNRNQVVLRILVLDLKKKVGENAVAFKI